jgi:3-oxoacyl-[acyl-carrier protein] reductase
MRVLITGAAGALGVAISDAMQTKHYVKPLSRSECDLSSIKSIETFVSENCLDFDAFIHVAGINKPINAITLSEDDLKETLQVNFFSGLYLARKLLPHMKKNSFGRIVFISSLWSHMGRSNRLAYSASKGAIDASMRCLATEYAKYNILVNSVSPGFVDTPLTRKNIPKSKLEDIFFRTPIGKFVEIKDIVRTVMFLCSEDNNALTGQNIIVDGGFMLSGDF